VRIASRSGLSGCILAALAGLAAVTATMLLTGCATDGAPSANPNGDMFRDYTDGKFDSAGHPLNARVTDGSTLCKDGACDGPIAGGAQTGMLVASAHLRVTKHRASGNVVAYSITGADGHVIAHDTLTVARLRDGWIDLPLAWQSDGQAVRAKLVPAAGAGIDLDYIEVFPQTFGLVVDPGSGVIADDAHLVFEIPRTHALATLTLDGSDTLSALAHATQTTTDFRTVDDIALADLAPARGDVIDLRATAGDTAVRLELRKTPPACNFEGNGDVKVLVTGFQPFPADAFHENVSAVAVTALDPAALHGARVMRLVMPVEYDRAAAEVTDAIARCAPDIVISFGQGGDAIALEEVAYNLQDTGEVAGGVPDNRGIVRAAVPIDEAAPATRDTLLPLDAIEQALVGLGEAPQHSRDPGRYICNNVMFADIGAMTGKRAGFIHLPYTTDFDDAARARFGSIAAAAIQAVVDQK